MHILGGVDRPDSGSVYMDGQDIYKQNDEQLAIFRRRQVGLIYQFYNLIPVLDAVENMTLPALLDGRKVEKSRINSGKLDRNAAPMIEPVSEPVPPMMTSESSSAE